MEHDEIAEILARRRATKVGSPPATHHQATARPQPPSRSVAAEGNELSAALWEERRVLAELVDELETASPRPAAQRPTAAVSAASVRVRTAGLARAMAVDALARAQALPADASLPELIVAAPEGPWAFIFTSHLGALRQLARRIEQLQSGGAHPAAPDLVPRPLRRFLR